ncbi:probable nucleoredoxin 3 [Chenopodium quinoa]|uniref:probable nucleoredoxin 3 n=1 Tax=Chenopodium quinoa TaxID=63459 RepID=UPI000B76E1AB|nr:probable nucleoredoxin 3 [Chenopodium quinoa]
MAGPDHHAVPVGQNGFKKILASEGIEFLTSASGKVLWSAIDGKTVCLFFSANWCRPCKAFTPSLIQMYNSLKKTGENLEIVFVSSDRDEEAYTKHLETMPWLAVPFNLNLCTRLTRLFNINLIPALIPLNVNGNIVEDNVVSLVEDYGADAFPFTRERKDELRAMDERKRRGGRIEELLAHAGRDYLISRNGEKILVSELVGKTIGLYFGAHWCPPARNFTSQLIQSYKELVTILNQPFEVIFISTDRDHDEFNCSLSSMPWPAIPYEDKTRQDLKRIFDIKGIPTLVLIGPDGKTISSNGRAMISMYGAMAFPFTEPRIAGIEASLRKEGDKLPYKVQDPKHVHELKLDMAKAYICDACKKQGRFWSFSCDVCDYDLHPKCVE